MDFKEFLALKELEKEKVSFEMSYVDIAKGDLVAGLLLSQIIYWFMPDKNNKFKTRVTYLGKKALAKSREEWYEEIRITPKQYDRAIKILEDVGVVEVRNSMFNGKKTPFITMNEDIFLELYKAEMCKKYPEEEKTDEEGGKPVLTKGENRNYLKVKTEITQRSKPLTETTTETTTEKEPYIYSEDGTNVLKDQSKEDLKVLETSLDKVEEDNTKLDKEADEFLDSDIRYPKDKSKFYLEYRKVRKKYPKDEIFDALNRYLAYKIMVGEDRTHYPENFLANRIFENFLDDSYLRDIDKIKRMKYAIEQKRIKDSKNVPSEIEAWNKDLDEIFGID